MHASMTVELAQLPAMERLQLAQDLIASVTSEQAGFVVNAAHKIVAQERMAYHLAHPDEPTMTLTQIREALGLS